MKKTIFHGLYLLMSSMLVAGLLLLCVTATAESSGSCGPDLTWTLNDDGLLVIQGTGPMTECPWPQTIKAVEVKTGVVSICDHAFRNCTELTSVMLPEGLESIGTIAFGGCTSLTSITIPDSVITIYKYAFTGCTSLTSVTIPDSAITIQDNAFSDCTNLKIPSTKIKYGLAGGTPVGEPEIITVNSVKGSGTIHSLKCQGLSNEYTRFILEYTVQEGCVISAYDRAKSTFRYYDVDEVFVTTSERSTLIFDVSNSNLPKASDIKVAFINVDNNYEWVYEFNFNPNQRTRFYSNYTDGVPMGVAEEVAFNTWTEDTGYEGTVHGLKRQKLDNGYDRFTLEYTVSERLQIDVFDPPEGEIYNNWSDMPVTSSNKSTLYFDISADDLDKIDSITIGFLDPNNESTWTLGINFDPTPEPETQQASLFSVNLTEGIPEGENEPVTHTIRASKPYDIQTIEHVFTRQNLNNNHTRFRLEYSVPADLRLILGVYAGTTPVIFYESESEQLTTSSESSILQFDVSNSDLESVTFVFVAFCDSNHQGEIDIEAGFTGKPILSVSTDASSYDYADVAVLTASITYANGSTEGLAELYPDAYIRATLMTESGSEVPGFIVQSRNGLEASFDFPLMEDSMEAGDYLIKVETNVNGLTASTEVFHYTADRSALTDPTKCQVRLTLSTDHFGFNERFVMTAHVTDQSGAPAKGVKVGFEVLKPDGSVANFYSNGASYLYNVTDQTGECGIGHTEKRTGEKLFKPGKYIVRAFLVDGNSYDEKDVEYRLHELRLPAATQCVEEESFAGSAFQMITVPQNCAAIGNRAFADCKELLYVVIPSGAEVADDAFEGCRDDLLIERK